MGLSRTASVLFAIGGAVLAAEPTLQHIAPVAGQQGTKVAVTVSGKIEPWPPQVWVDAPGIVFQPAKAKGKFEVEIAQDAAPGPHLVRIFNSEGASAPRYFIVSPDPELADMEPNDDFKTPQKIAQLPATIGGRLNKNGDVDSFGVSLKKGQALTARVEAYVLGSTFDGMLRIVDDGGLPCAFNHDGRTLDPLLTWAAPRDGTFVVQLMGFAYPATSNVQFTGGDGCVYRLHLTTAPPAPIENQGIAEQEPNNTAANAQTLTLPSTIAACIEKADDEDRFAFTTVKGQMCELKVVSARDGRPLDAWVKVESKDGKELARNDDDGGSRDPLLTWTAPADGTFIAAVGDVTHHGGKDFAYRLSVAEAKPAVTATMGYSVAVKAGQTAEIKVAVKRTNGFKARLQLAAKNLPEGVTAPEVEVPAKDGDVTLKLTATETAPAASQPVQLILREVESGAETPVQHFMTMTSENNGVPQGYTELVINSTDQLWLAVINTAPKPESPRPEPPPATPNR